MSLPGTFGAEKRHLGSWVHEFLSHIILLYGWV